MGLNRNLYASKAWRDLRLRLIDQARFKCQICGKSGEASGGPGRALEVDHKVPVSRGGALLDPENLQVLCRGCHMQKTRRENTPALQPQGYNEDGTPWVSYAGPSRKW